MSVLVIPLSNSTGNLSRFQTSRFFVDLLNFLADNKLPRALLALSFPMIGTRPRLPHGALWHQILLSWHVLGAEIKQKRVLWRIQLPACANQGHSEDWRCDRDCALCQWFFYLILRRALSTYIVCQIRGLMTLPLASIVGDKKQECVFDTSNWIVRLDFHWQSHQCWRQIDQTDVALETCRPLSSRHHMSKPGLIWSLPRLEKYNELIIFLYKPAIAHFL